MARIRTVKPEFFTSEDIGTLTPLARLFYVALWCEADKAGRLKWSPKTLKVRYIPFDDCDINDLASELTALGLIRIYDINGTNYADIPSFTVHQVINNREKDSLIPAFTENTATRESGVKVAASGKEGKEGKGKEGIDACAPEPDGGTDPVQRPDDETIKSQIIARFKSVKYLNGRSEDAEERRQTYLAQFSKRMGLVGLRDFLDENFLEIIDEETLKKRLTSEAKRLQQANRPRLEEDEMYDWKTALGVSA